MVDRDGGQRTAALVIALWRAAWIWRWFVQPAIVWCRGATPRRPLHRHPPYTARTLRWRWQARRAVVVGPRPMLGKRRAPWGGSSVVAAGSRGGGHRCRSEPQGAWEPQKQKKRRCKGDASAMQGRHSGDARRTPWALPWQPHGSGADLRWKGRREEENNAPVQSDQLLRRTGLAHQDKVQTERQTGQVTVTVTHNRMDRATRRRRARGEGGGRPAANDRGWRRWWTEGPEGRGQGEWRRARGWEPGAP